MLQPSNDVSQSGAHAVFTLHQLIYKYTYFGNYGNTKSCEISSVSLLIGIPNLMKIGIKLMKLQSEVALFSNIFSKTVILPQHTINVPVLPLENSRR